MIAIDAYRERERAEYFRTATVAHTIYSVNRGKSGRRLKVEDFMPRWAAEGPDSQRIPRRQTTEEQVKILELWKEALGSGSKRR